MNAGQAFSLLTFDEYAAWCKSRYPDTQQATSGAPAPEDENGPSTKRCPESPRSLYPEGFR